MTSRRIIEAGDVRVADTITFPLDDGTLFTTTVTGIAGPPWEVEISDGYHRFLFGGDETVRLDHR